MSATPAARGLHGARAEPVAAASGRARWDEWLASAALLLMTLIPLVEMLLRPMMGRGVMNAPVIVQHMGLVMAMFGAVAAERNGHLTTLGSSVDQVGNARARALLRGFAWISAALVCGALAQAGWRFVDSERGAGQVLAYGVPVWWVQAAMPLGFALLAVKLGARSAPPAAAPEGAAGRSAGLGFADGSAVSHAIRWALALGPLAAGWWLAARFEGHALPLWPAMLWLLAVLLTGAPIFAVLGGLALALFWSDALPLASVPLSHYQITVNPSLPALPLFTLAGLLLARTGAAQRLGVLFLALFGSGVRGTVLAAAVLCSAFTALTGGSGVTILALGGLLLPMLQRAGYREQRGIGLVTSASALGVLLAPSVPLIMYAVIARVPIQDMFLAGVVPALVMVACLLFVGGYLRRDAAAPAAAGQPASAGPGDGPPTLAAAAWAAKWELAAPLVAVGSLASGLATPTESAALTAAYAALTQSLAHRELGARLLARTLSDCAQIIGGVMLILGMALALTNFMVDTGVPDAAVEWVRSVIPNRYAFLFVLCLFLFAAAALMEIFAAIVVLVPLLLPLSKAYGIDPVHFGVIFLAAMEVGFLCPPAGMNIYFAAAMFGRSIRYVAASVLPAVLAIFIGTIIIALLPGLATGLPRWLLRM